MTNQQTHIEATSPFAGNRDFDLDVKEKVEHLDNAAQEEQPVALKSEFDNLTAWQALKTFKVVSLYCCAAAFSAATDGYQININGNILANKGFIQQFGTTTDAAGVQILDAAWISSWSAIQSVGQIMAMTSIYLISDRYGRRVALFTLWFVLALSVMTESLATKPWHWLIGKLLAGVGVGALQATVPAYIAELAPTRIRGALLLAYSFSFGLGGFVGPVALRELNLRHPYSWRIPILSQWGQIALMLVIYIFLPESPWYCARRNLDQKGKALLTRLYGKVPGYNIEYEWQLIHNVLDQEKRQAEDNGHVSFWEIFRGANLRRTIASTIPLTLQQFTGLALIYTYSTYFFQSAGQKDPFLTTLIVNSIKMIVILAGAYLSDKFGRRPIVLTASILCWIGLMVIGGLGLVPLNDKVGAVLILFACVWNVGATSLGALGWAYVGETSSSRLRSKTAGFAAAISCIFGIAFGVGVPYMLNKNYINLGLKTAFFFAGISAPTIVAAWFMLPETANRAPADLDELFERNIRPWKFATTKTQVQLDLDSRVGRA